MPCQRDYEHIILLYLCYYFATGIYIRERAYFIIDCQELGYARDATFVFPAALTPRYLRFNMPASSRRYGRHAARPVDASLSRRAAGRHITPEIAAYMRVPGVPPTLILLSTLAGCCAEPMMLTKRSMRRRARRESAILACHLLVRKRCHVLSRLRIKSLFPRLLHLSFHAYATLTPHFIDYFRCRFMAFIFGDCRDAFYLLPPLLSRHARRFTTTHSKLGPTRQLHFSENARHYYATISAIDLRPRAATT